MQIFSFFTFCLFYLEIILRCLKLFLINKILLKNLLSYAIFDVLEQSILFIFLGKYGLLALSMITSVRKILSISLSVLYFGNTIYFPRSISLLIAVSIILWEIYDKGNKGKTTEINNKNE